MGKLRGLLKFCAVTTLLLGVLIPPAFFYSSETSFAEEDSGNKPPQPLFSPLSQRITWEQEPPSRPFTLSLEAQAYLARTSLIRIAIPDSNPPLAYFDDANLPMGLFAAFLSALNERLGGKIQAVPMPHTKHGESAFISFDDEFADMPDAVMSMWCELPKGSIASDPFLRSSLALVFRADASDAKMKTVMARQGAAMSLAVLEEELLHCSALADFVSEARVTRFPTMTEALRAVVQGDVEAFVGGLLLIEDAVMASRGHDFRVLGTSRELLYTFAVDARQPDLLEVINSALAALTPQNRDQLVAQWYKAVASPLNLTHADKAWLKAHPILGMGVTSNWLPFEFISVNGDYQGVVADYSDWLAEVFGIQFNVKSDMTHDGLLDALAEGKLDLVAGTAWSSERASQVLFTRPYLHLPLVLLMRSDADPVMGLEDLRGKKVAVLRGFLSGNILRRFYPHIIPKNVKSTAEALKLLANGEVSAVFDALDAVSYHIRRGDYSTLTTLVHTPYSYDLCFAVRPDMPELAALIDKGLDAIPHEKSRMFYEQWVQARTTSVMNWAMFWRVLAVLGVGVLGVLAVVMYTNRKLRAQVEERRKAESALTTVLSHLPGVFSMCDTQLRFQFVNQEFTTIYGIEGKQAYGKQLIEIYKENGVSEQRMERARDYMSMLWDVVDKGTPVVLEHRVGDGVGDAWFVTRHVPLLNRAGKVYGVVSLASDITSAKLLEHELNARLSFSQALLDALPNPVFLQDMKGRYSLINETMELLTGQSRASLLGKTAQDNLFFRFDERTEIYRDVQRLLREGGTSRREVRSTTFAEPDGVALLWQSAFCPQPDTIAGVVTVAADITDLKRLEKQLNLAKEEAESALLAKSEFLANMSHEIRTPMNAILGLCHLVQQSKLTPYQADHLRKLDGAAETLLGILNDILDFSKIEAGKLLLENVPFYLRDALGTVETTLTLAAAQKGLRIHIHIEPDVPECLKGDPLRLSQVLINLANNAVKFTERGEIALDIGSVPSVEPSATNPSAAEDGITLRFSLRDTGIGMNEDQVSHLFQAFSQGDASITRRYGGTGLGLAISRQLVDAMGGRLSVESREGEGSCFTFTAKLGVVNTEESGNMALAGMDLADGPMANLSAGAILAGKRVLLVEDNDINQLVAEELLHALGLEVDIAANGVEAVRMAHKAFGLEPDDKGLPALAALAHDEPLIDDRVWQDKTLYPYDIILMDIQMPVLDGLRAATIISRSEGLQHVPIVAMTAHVTAADKLKSLNAGMREHLTKPIKPEELKKVLLRYLTPEKQA